MFGKEGKQLEFSEDIIAREQKNRAVAVLRATPGIVLSGIVLTTLAYGFKEGSTDIALKFIPDPHFPKPKSKDGIEGLQYFFNAEEITEDNKSQLIYQFLDGREAFVNFSDYELKTNYNDETKDFIREQRIETVIEGCVLLSKLGENVGFGDNGETIVVDDIIFDMNDVYRTLVLDQIIVLKLELLKQDDYSPVQDSVQVNKKLEDLRWLVHQDLDIRFSNDSYPLVLDGTLVTLARMYRTMKDLGYPLPSKISWVAYPGGGENTMGHYLSWVQEIEMTPTTLEEDIVHEWAHLLAHKSDQFSQDEFNKRVSEVKENVVLELAEDEYINPGVLDESWNKDSRVEDYAETIAYYFSNGVSFRDYLKRIEPQNNPAYLVLKAKYDFAKSLFGGKEYLTEGEEFNPEVGDVFEIINLEDEVFMDKNGNSLNDDDSKLRSYQHVEIIDGPSSFTDSETGEKEILWKVKKVIFNGSSYTPDPIENKKEGWVFQDWLGHRLNSAENQTEQ